MQGRVPMPSQPPHLSVLSRIAMELYLNAWQVQSHACVNVHCNRKQGKNFPILILGPVSSSYG